MNINLSNINSSNINSLLASLMIERLVGHGVDYFCISPGSRSTPLAVAVAGHPKARALVHFDERGTAFHALGFARASDRPAVLICTSGTAVANLLPAVVEASMTDLPMILLTADRPPELRQTGANQTIDQVDIFGNFTRLFVDLPCPVRKTSPGEILALMDQAVAKATGSPAGPVHINCMYREPLAPIDDGIDYSDYLAKLSDSEQTNLLLADDKFDITNHAEDEFETVLSIIESSADGIIVAGALAQSTDHTGIIKLADRLNWPVLCDITSGFRLSDVQANRVTYYDQLLLSESAHKLLKPDCCLHLGGTVTSRRLIQALDSWHPRQYLQIKTGELPFDPNRQVTHRIDTNPDDFCERLWNRVSGGERSQRLTELIDLSDGIDEVIEQTLTEAGDLSEPMTARTVSRLLPKDHGLFLASSLAIRAMDMYGIGHRIAVDHRHGISREPAVRIGANRGASGIDGTVASATGFATGLGRPVTLLIGDLAALHDLNSLALLSQTEQPVTMVLLNNNGGRIFSGLPIAQFDKVVEKFFITPHGFEFEPAAEMFGLPYTKVASAEMLAETFHKHLSLGKSSLVEVIIDADQSETVYRQLSERIGAELKRRLT